MRNLVFTLLLLLPFLSWSQISHKTERYTFAPAATISPMETQDEYEPALLHLEMPNGNGHTIKDLLVKRKGELSKKYPYRSVSKPTPRYANSGPYPDTMFSANPYNSRIPNDNDLAVSNDGHLISVINSTIYMYDLNGDSLLQWKTLATFAQPLGFTQSKFDPKVIYDPMADRFIMIFLNGSSYLSSKLILGFSSTSNPTDPWNLYALPGDPLNNTTWHDYPVVGISNQDLFIGINTFFNGSVNNSGFFESTFWQIALQNGYNGDTLNTAYYHDIAAPNDTLFNITPIPMGAENLNTDMFLLSNKNVSTNSDSLYILHVTNSLASGNTTLEMDLVSCDREYFLPPNARQANNLLFETNDSRILGGFQVGNSIQFVQSTLDTSNGLAGIYHGFISDIYINPSVHATIISDTLKDYGFPNIAWTGIDSNDPQAMIIVNFTSPQDFSGMGMIQLRSDSSYSPLTILKNGNTTIDIQTGPNDRWGDYSGIQRRYNEPCKVWAAGSYSSAAAQNATWIAEVAADTVCWANPVLSSEEMDDLQEVQLFPNPASHYFTIDFEVAKEDEISIDVYDLNGRLIQHFLDDRIRAGKNRFTFSTQPLPEGIYLLQIKGKADLYVNQKVIVRR